jgi:hypothetical protein
MGDGALKMLRIEHLRGAVRPFVLPFEPGKKLTIVYGENGSGKSTICDAFELVGKGKVGSLEHRGLGRTERYWQSLGKQRTDVCVELETEGGTFRATLGRSGVDASLPDRRPRVEVLRRRQVQELIEATPGERYGAIRRFVDVEGVEASEASLRQLIKDVQASRDLAAARVQENREAIRQLWEVAGRRGADPLGWAEAELRREPGSADAEIAALEGLSAAFSRLAEYPEQLSTAESELADLRRLRSEAQRELHERLAMASADAAGMVEILQAAKGYLAGHPTPPACPLCESAERAGGLAERVEARLATFAAIREARATLSARERQVQRAEEALAVLQASALDHAGAFEDRRAAVAWPAGVPLPREEAQASAAELSTWLANHAHLPAAWRQAAQARQDARQFQAALQGALESYRENSADQETLDALLPRLRRTLDVVEEERRRFTDATLAAIAADVRRLYEAVHPGEGLNRMTLILDPRRRASLEIGASFGGQDDAPPQAYFSDSHLDTLGLCIFLALAGLEEPADTILVLDDVLASVDEPHVDRLIEMLYEEAGRFRHCILTTHYRPWRERLRWGWLRNGPCQFVELSRWSESSGLRLLRRLPPEVQRLRTLLADPQPDPRLVCPTAGVILGSVLDFLTQLYECPVPRRPGGRYTVGELLPASDRELRQALRVEILDGSTTSGPPAYTTVELAPYLEELTRIAEARALFGVQFHQLSSDLLGDDAEPFGQQVLCLVTAVIDDAVGWPRSDRSGRYWATAGETRRLHPLARPNASASSS